MRLVLFIQRVVVVLLLLRHVINQLKLVDPLCDSVMICLQRHEGFLFVGVRLPVLTGQAAKMRAFMVRKAHALFDPFPPIRTMFSGKRLQTLHDKAMEQVAILQELPAVLGKQVGTNRAASSFVRIYANKHGQRVIRLDFILGQHLLDVVRAAAVGG